MPLSQISQWIAVQAVTGLNIAYLPSDALLLRSGAVITIILMGTSMQLDALAAGRDLRIAGPLAAMGWVNVLNGIELLLLSRVSYPAQLEWETSQKRTPTWQFTWAFWMPYNYRRIRTPWQIKYMPTFSRRDPDYVPSKRDFLLLCAGKIAICALILPLFTLGLQYPGLYDNLAILWGERTDVSFLHRAVVTTSFMIPFVILTRAVIVGVFTTMALVFVGLGVSEPALWPPISGSVLDAWSIRRLWGITWHQMLRTCLLAHVNLILSSVLHIPSRSSMTYVLRLVLVFVLSGAVHVGMDLGFSVPFRNTGAIWFFTLQAVGMLVEQVVQSIWYTLSGRKGMGTSMVERMVGHLWVAVFLSATAPIWLIPIFKGLYEGGERSPVPLVLGWGVFLA